MLVMKSSPPRLSLLILIISTSFMFGLGSVVTKTYTHVPLHYTWEEAWHNCKSSDSNLAIVQTEEDKGMINYVDFFSWVGQRKVNGSNKWEWSPGLQQFDYLWADGEPQPNDSCASVFSTQQVYGFPCEDYFFFYCNINEIQLFIKESKTWREAQEYCRQNYNKLIPLILNSDLDFSLWIDDTVTEPRDKCATITTQTKTMADRNCSDHFPSVCMTDNVILIKKKKTWEGAMEHCRKMVRFTTDNSRYELVSVEAGTDDAFLRARASQADTEQVWVGLRFLGGMWFWINGEPVENLDLPQCPLPGKNCGVISKTAAHLETVDCGEKKNFFCYKLN